MPRLTFGPWNDGEISIDGEIMSDTVLKSHHDKWQNGKSSYSNPAGKFICAY